MTERKALLARMEAQMREWDEDEPRDDWWQYQRDFAAAHAHLSAQPSPDEGAGEPVSSADFQQQRGRALDLSDWAIEEYRGFMLDDDYDAQGTLDRIITRLRDTRPELYDPRATPSPDDSLGRLREALSRLESANDALCATRSQNTYLRMIDVDKASDALAELDAARRQAREALALSNSTDSQEDGASA
jgi:hypothetical protein